MKVRRLLFAVPLVGTALAAPVEAQTPYGLDAYCPHSPVPATHGDSPGLVDFSYSVRSAFGAGQTNVGGLSGWTTGYSTLPCALWGSSQSAPLTVGDIRVNPVGSPNTVRIDELTFGRWQSSLKDINVRIYSDDYSSLLFSGVVDDVSNIAKSITPGTLVAGPVHIQWDDPWWSGLGSAAFTFQAPLGPTLAPEPSTVALTALGLGVLAAAARRRRV